MKGIGRCIHKWMRTSFKQEDSACDDLNLMECGVEGSGASMKPSQQKPQELDDTTAQPAETRLTVPQLIITEQQGPPHHVHRYIPTAAPPTNLWPAGITGAGSNGGAISYQGTGSSIHHLQSIITHGSADTQAHLYSTAAVRELGPWQTEPRSALPYQETRMPGPTQPRHPPQTRQLPPRAAQYTHSPHPVPPPGGLMKPAVPQHPIPPHHVLMPAVEHIPPVPVQLPAQAPPPGGAVYNPFPAGTYTPGPAEQQPSQSSHQPSHPSEQDWEEDNQPAAAPAKTSMFKAFLRDIFGLKGMFGLKGQKGTVDDLQGPLIPMHVQDTVRHGANPHQPTWGRAHPLTGDLCRSQSCSAVKPLSDQVDQMLAEHWQAPMSVRRIRKRELVMGPEIGHGGFGKVYKAEWRGQVCAIKEATVKIRTDQTFKQFKQEVEAMSCLTKHEHVMELIGYYREGNDVLGVVMEYCPGGSLFDRMHGPNPLPGRGDYEQVRQLLLQIAKGMVHLHLMNVVHRDLKSANILINKRGKLVITDFGLARVAGHDQYMTQGCGTYQWMAPEVINDRPYGKKADVYSFAIIMWELLSRQLPFHGQNAVVAAKHVADGARPPIPAAPAPKQLVALMQRCWHGNPHLRPGFPEIVKELTDMPQHWQHGEQFVRVPKEPRLTTALEPALSCVHEGVHEGTTTASAFTQQAGATMHPAACVFVERVPGQVQGKTAVSPWHPPPPLPGGLSPRIGTRYPGALGGGAVPGVRVSLNH